MKHFYLRSGILTAVIIFTLGLFVTAGMVNAPAVRATLSAKDASAEHASISSPSHIITVKDLGGYVAVYRDGAFDQMTDIPVSSLPGCDRDALAQGIEVADEMDLNRLLEDLGA